MDNTSQTPKVTYFTDYEVHPCRESANYVTQCEPDEADYWTVYGRLNIGGLEAIGDFVSEEAANEVVRQITHQSTSVQNLLIYIQDNELSLMEAAEDINAFINKIYNLLEH